MTIDLSGLLSVDAEISMQGTSFMVFTQNQQCMDDLRVLPPPIWVHELKQGVFVIDPKHIDEVALAERIATSWELLGLTVRRTVTPLRSDQKQETQSFLIGV